MESAVPSRDPRSRDPWNGEGLAISHRRDPGRHRMSHSSVTMSDTEAVARHACSHHTHLPSPIP